MKAADHIRMPDRIDNIVEVAMSPKEQKIYDSFENDMVISLKGEDLDAVNAAALSTKLLQMANGAVYGEDRKVIPIHEKKLDALEDLVESANGKPLLVAYWYQHDRDRILGRIKDGMIERTIDIDGKKVPFRSSATIPRLYRAKFKRDIFQDLSKLEKSYNKKAKEGDDLQIEDLEIFENVAYVMAYHADSTIPKSIDEWLDQFEMFSIYQVLPEILELWGKNMMAQVEAKKGLAEVSGK